MSIPKSCCFKSAITSCRSEEHTSELQSQSNLVCRLLLEKKNPDRRWTVRLAGIARNTLGLLLLMNIDVTCTMGWRLPDCTRTPCLGRPCGLHSCTIAHA